MEEQKNRRFFKPNALTAVLVFLFLLLVMIFVFSFAQYYLGMWGLVITEIGFVIIALSAAVIFNVNIKEMIPLKKIKVNEFFGTLIIWFGAFMLDIVINIIFFYFFPKGLEVSADLNDFFGTWPAAASLLVVSVMPAICEEIMHRGFIQTCISKSVHNKWLICIIMALFFGVFHMDLYRFLGTAVLGGVLAYILIETGNFWYNMLFHFFNNFFIQAISIFSGAAAAEESTDLLKDGISAMVVAVYLMFACVIPFILLGGSMLLKGMNKLKQEGKKKIVVSIVAASVIAALLFFAGVVMLIYIIMNG